MALRRQRKRNTLEIGLDEAGRGCLAGPVTAAAVVLYPGRRSPTGMDDSKRMTPERRSQLRNWLENNTLAWAVAHCSAARVDEENVLQASMTAMHRATEQVLQQLAALTGTSDNLAAFLARPRLLLVDGHYFRPYPGVDHSCEVKGDGRFQSIAAASILAKTHRDELMGRYHKQYPHYDWASNKGYPTPAHRAAIAAYGPTPLHRRSFRW